MRFAVTELCCALLHASGFPCLRQKSSVDGFLTPILNFLGITDVMFYEAAFSLFLFTCHVLSLSHSNLLARVALSLDNGGVMWQCLQ